MGKLICKFKNKQLNNNLTIQINRIANKVDKKEGIIVIQGIQTIKYQRQQMLFQIEGILFKANK